MRSVLLAVVTVLAALSVQAQTEGTTLPLDRFRAPIDDRGLGVTEGAAIPSHLSFQTGLVLNYALNPLVLRDANNDVAAAIVAHRLAGNAQFTVGLLDYVSLGVDLPLMLANVGGDVPASVEGLVGVASGLATIGLGDLKLVPKMRILREDRHGISLAVIPAITFPTAGGLSFQDGVRYDYGGSYLGEGPGRLAFIPEVVLSTNVSGLRPALNLAYRLRQPTTFLEDFTVHPELIYRLGVGYDLSVLNRKMPAVLVFGEIFGATADQNPFGLFTPADLSGDARARARAEVRMQNPIEWLVGARWRTPLGPAVEGGVGTGLRAGFGSPELRAFLGVRWIVDDDDNDDDGVSNEKDQCLNQPEDKDGHEDLDGCPDADNDGDGLPDDVDRCPMAQEDIDTVEDDDGCPDPDDDQDGIPDVDDRCRDVFGDKEHQGCPIPDRDADGVPDHNDRCPDDKGPKERLGCPIEDRDRDSIEDSQDSCPDQFVGSTTQGCPDGDQDGVADRDDRCPSDPGVVDLRGCKDQDSDGIADPDDQCPTEAETINGIKDADGCPDKGKELVVVTADRIEIKDTIYFDAGKDTIQRRSFPLLGQIALVLKAHEEIKKVRVEGHTDADGNDDKNLDLSKRRARAVMLHLAKQGVSLLRMESEGYGEQKPIADNKTKAGKAKNRRVEFVIVPPE